MEWIMDGTGMPLGLFPDATFETRQCQFRTDQVLVLGTDGATETLDDTAAEFGRNGVIRYVETHSNETAAEVAAGVYAAAQLFGTTDPAGSHHIRHHQGHERRSRRGAPLRRRP
jgi:serine phosphatase RsbU (regulator of sigma subunit)